MWRLNRENKITLFIIKIKHYSGTGILINSESQDWAIYIILYCYYDVVSDFGCFYMWHKCCLLFFKGFITVKCRPCLNVSDCSSSSNFCFYKLSCYILITDDSLSETPLYICICIYNVRGTLVKNTIISRKIYK